MSDPNILSSRDMLAAHLFHRNPARRVDRLRRLLDDANPEYEVDAVSEITSQVGNLPTTGGILLQSQTVTVPRQVITFNNIPSTYDVLQIFIECRPATDDDHLQLKLNNTSVSYKWALETKDSGAGGTTRASDADTQIFISADSANQGQGNAAGEAGSFALTLMNYATGTSSYRTLHWRGSYFKANATVAHLRGAGAWLSTNPITSITLQLQNGNFAGAIARLYGMAV